MPDASIGSDIIVGFPGETDDDFEQLASYLDVAADTPPRLSVLGPPGNGGVDDARQSSRRRRPRARRVRFARSVSRLAARFRESQLGTVQRGADDRGRSLVVTGNYLKLRIPPGRRATNGCA